MSRLHLIEIEDQPWCPAFLRDAVTDYLAFVENLTAKPYEAFVESLIRAMEATGDQRIVDLCSGGGGPLPTLSKLLTARGYSPQIKLTDLHPNRPRFEQLTEQYSNFSAVFESIDARNVPPTLQGLRLLCEGFHHFAPHDAQAILRDAVEQHQPIAVFELVARTPGSLLGVLLSPPFVVLGGFFIRPFSWQRLLFTTLIPLIPLLILFDGIVSCLRIYDPSELETLIQGVDGSDGYDWTLERRRLGLGKTTFLVGYPRPSSEGSPSAMPPAG